ncbi:hypothetical protein PPERSA_05443 [Pseudocohnilembus persalinus]|uniref:Uncharacterized protein n=1 Tax=Pseudocohnilembus persalinus TaxID=266149 RepID=A0A0V0R808_PSEPJ|nr:hypothetical protein PPERSA_05443 [Pseudocohnilembus persalinus]|eukprot:KRX10623.1 hypothetical protein PPERSA_05443 [Pseudocohnilembus persalinus]
MTYQYDNTCTLQQNQNNQANSIIFDNNQDTFKLNNIENSKLNMTYQSNYNVQQVSTQNNEIKCKQQLDFLYQSAQSESIKDIVKQQQNVQNQDPTNTDYILYQKNQTLLQEKINKLLKEKEEIQEKFEQQKTENQKLIQTFENIKFQHNFGKSEQKQDQILLAQVENQQEQILQLKNENKQISDLLKQTDSSIYEKYFLFKSEMEEKIFNLQNQLDKEKQMNLENTQNNKICQKILDEINSIQNDNQNENGNQNFNQDSMNLNWQQQYFLKLKQNKEIENQIAELKEQIEEITEKYDKDTQKLKRHREEAYDKIKHLQKDRKIMKNQLVDQNILYDKICSLEKKNQKLQEIQEDNDKLQQSIQETNEMEKNNKPDEIYQKLEKLYYDSRSSLEQERLKNQELRKQISQNKEDSQQRFGAIVKENLEKDEIIKKLHQKLKKMQGHPQSSCLSSHRYSSQHQNQNENSKQFTPHHQNNFSNIINFNLFDLSQSQNKQEKTIQTNRSIGKISYKLNQSKESMSQSLSKNKNSRKSPFAINKKKNSSNLNLANLNLLNSSVNSYSSKNHIDMLSPVSPLNLKNKKKRLSAYNHSILPAASSARKRIATQQVPRQENNRNQESEQNCKQQEQSYIYQKTENCDSQNKIYDATVLSVDLNQNFINSPQDNKNLYQRFNNENKNFKSQSHFKNLQNQQQCNNKYQNSSNSQIVSLNPSRKITTQEQVNENSNNNNNQQKNLESIQNLKKQIMNSQCQKIQLQTKNEYQNCNNNSVIKNKMNIQQQKPNQIHSSKQVSQQLRKILYEQQNNEQQQQTQQNQQQHQIQIVKSQTHQQQQLSNQKQKQKNKQKSTQFLKKSQNLLNNNNNLQTQKNIQKNQNQQNNISINDQSNTNLTNFEASFSQSVHERQKQLKNQDISNNNRNQIKENILENSKNTNNIKKNNNNNSSKKLILQQQEIQSQSQIPQYKNNNNYINNRNINDNDDIKQKQTINYIRTSHKDFQKNVFLGHHEFPLEQSTPIPIENNVEQKSQNVTQSNVSQNQNQVHQVIKYHTTTSQSSINITQKVPNFLKKQKSIDQEKPFLTQKDEEIQINRQNQQDNLNQIKFQTQQSFYCEDDEKGQGISLSDLNESFALKKNKSKGMIQKKSSIYNKSSLNLQQKQSTQIQQQQQYLKSEASTSSSKMKIQIPLSCKKNNDSRANSYIKNQYNFQKSKSISSQNHFNPKQISTKKQKQQNIIINNKDSLQNSQNPQNQAIIKENKENYPANVYQGLNLQKNDSNYNKIEINNITNTNNYQDNNLILPNHAQTTKNNYKVRNLNFFNV